MRKKIKQFLIITVMILLLNPIKSFAWGMDEVREAAEKTFKAWLDQYTAETANEEEKLKVYYLTNFSAFSSYEEFKDGEDIVVKMGALVYPEKEDSSKWSQYEKHPYENSKDGIGYSLPDYYMRMSKVGENYEIVYMDVIPEGYKEYVQAMKEKGIDVENLNLEQLLNTEYQETIEITEQNAEVQELKAENKIIEKTRIGIIIFCSLMLVIVLGFYIKRIVSK